MVKYCHLVPEKVENWFKITGIHICMNTGMTIIFIFSYKINKSDSKQEFKLIQIGLSLVRVEFRELYTEFQNHISTYI